MEQPWICTGNISIKCNDIEINKIDNLKIGEWKINKSSICGEIISGYIGENKNYRKDSYTTFTDCVGKFTVECFSIDINHATYSINTHKDNENKIDSFSIIVNNENGEKVNKWNCNGDVKILCNDKEIKTMNNLKSGEWKIKSHKSEYSYKNSIDIQLWIDDKLSECSKHLDQRYVQCNGNIIIENFISDMNFQSVLCSMSLGFDGDKNINQIKINCKNIDEKIGDDWYPTKDIQVHNTSINNLKLGKWKSKEYYSRIVNDTITMITWIDDEPNNWENICEKYLINNEHINIGSITNIKELKYAKYELFISKDTDNEVVGIKVVLEELIEGCKKTCDYDSNIITITSDNEILSTINQIKTGTWNYKELQLYCENVPVIMTHIGEEPTNWILHDEIIVKRHVNIGKIQSSLWYFEASFKIFVSKNNDEIVGICLLGYD